LPEVIEPKHGPDYVKAKLHRLKDAIEGEGKSKDKLKLLEEIEKSISDSTTSYEKKQIDA
jgi:hypothetical protein